MYATIFRAIRPYLFRFLARHVAEYLQSRREERLKKPAEEPTPSTSEAMPEEIESSSPRPKLSSAEAVWYTISGLLLGSAIGYALAYIIRQED